MNQKIRAKGYTSAHHTGLVRWGGEGWRDGQNRGKVTVLPTEWVFADAKAGWCQVRTSKGPEMREEGKAFSRERGLSSQKCVALGLRGAKAPVPAA